MYLNTAAIIVSINQTRNSLPNRTPPKCFLEREKEDRGTVQTKNNVISPAKKERKKERKKGKKPAEREYQLQHTTTGGLTEGCPAFFCPVLYI